MIQDNFGIISTLIKSKNAFFARHVISDKAYYFAGNRAARRILKSNTFANLAKQKGLELDLEVLSVA